MWIRLFSIFGFHMCFYLYGSGTFHLCFNIGDYRYGTVSKCEGKKLEKVILLYCDFYFLFLNCYLLGPEEKNGFQIRTKFSGMDPQIRFRTKLLLIQKTEKKEEHFDWIRLQLLGPEKKLIQFRS
jgi:hypothetical protein